MPDHYETFLDGLNEHLAVATAMRDGLAGPFADMLDAWHATVAGGGKILFFGNGGSASDAQHIATELVVRLVGDRPAIAAIALTTDTSALTAAGNDMGFERIFARQVEALARPGDLALGISTSGNSRNVVRALEQARSMGVATASFTGASHGAVGAVSDHNVSIPSQVTARIQEMHITLAHLLCAALEKRLGFA